MSSEGMHSTFYLLKNAISRHLDETRLLLKQVNNEMLYKDLVAEGRNLGEILLHMIRSLEYYTRGIAISVWEPLDYTLNKFNSIEKIWELYEYVVNKIRYCLENLYLSPLVLNEIYEGFNRPATTAEILLEMLEHSIQHRGQIIVYLRLCGVVPVKIPYII